MFKPNDTNYDYYYRAMRPVLKKFKENMPNTEFLMFSCSDRAFNYDGTWKTAIGIDSLIATQARLAYNNDSPFYNFYKSIGGNGTIVKWADSTVQYANKDYIHFNYKGSKIVAKTIFKAFINDYNKAVKLKKANLPIVSQKTIITKHIIKESLTKKIDTPKIATPRVENPKLKEPIQKPTMKKIDSL